MAKNWVSFTFSFLCGSFMNMSIWHFPAVWHFMFWSFLYFSISPFYRWLWEPLLPYVSAKLIVWYWCLQWVFSGERRQGFGGGGAGTPIASFLSWPSVCHVAALVVSCCCCCFNLCPDIAPRSVNEKPTGRAHTSCSCFRKSFLASIEQNEKRNCYA